MGSSDEGSATTRTLDEAIEQDGTRLVRFALASLGSRAEATALVEAALVQSDAAQAGGDVTAFARGRLYGLVRKKAAQLAEQRRRAGGGERLDPNPLLEHVRPTEREALLLRYVARLSLADLASAAGTDEASARSRLSRGLSFLCRLDSGSADVEAAEPEILARRRRVEESLADAVDGLLADELSDFVADDDPSRDLVHDAERLAASIAALESNEEASLPELTQRFKTGCAAARDLAREAAPPTTNTATTNTATTDTATTNTATTNTATTDTATTDTATTDAATTDAATTNTATTTAGAAPAPAPRAGSGAPGAGRRRVAIALAVAAVAGVGALLVARSGRDPARYADASFAGTVGTVSRAFGGGVGLERCSPDKAVCSRVDRGDEVPAGSTLRTDGQTRAVIALRDGTELVLDRDTELLLDGAYARRARIDHGSVVVDVPPLAASRARFNLPLGFAETESGKVSLVAEASRAEVEVARGAVRLVDTSERGVAVHVGEAGRLELGSAPVVYEAGSLGNRFGWTERAFPGETRGEPEIVGLGELGAKRPGEDHERKGLVTLASHTTRVRIAGNVARTEIEEEFKSASDDVLEGVFRFPLPPDAQIERLALDVDGKVEEGAFVDRDRASAIWRGAIVNAGAKKPAGEEIVWVPGPWRDPALLEWQRGGRFELRIYPIPKRASRKVLLAYTQVVPPSGGVRRYVYPLPYDPGGSTRIGRFDVDVEVRGTDARSGVVARGYEMRQQSLPEGVRQLSLVKEGFSPSGDLTIEYSLPDAVRELTAWAYQPGPDESSAERAANALTGAAPTDGTAAYAALALRPQLPRSQDALERDFAIVVDSSRSMYGERYRRASMLAENVVREMDRGDRVTVLACDSTCRELPAGLVVAGPEAAHAVAGFLQGITPEGGSDVARGVRRGSEALRGSPKGAARIVYIGDGTPTIGPVGPAFVRREIEASVPRDAGTVTAVAIGSDADVTTLSALADAGGGVVVPYTPGQTVLDTAFALLGATYGTTLSDAELELPDGLYDVAPRKLGSLRAGSETMVVFRMTRPTVSGTVTLRGKVGGAPFEQRYPLSLEATTSKGNAFVPRLWAAGKIAELDGAPSADNRRASVELSGRFHVASRYTSLLVLESAAMMHAFGLSRDDHTALWTGESTAESSGADGETAVLDRDDGQGALADANGAALDQAPATHGLGTSSGRASAPELREESEKAARPSPAPAPVAQAPRSAAAPQKEELYGRDSDEGMSDKRKKDYAAPPPPAPTEQPRGGLGGLGGSALAVRPPTTDMAGPALMRSPFIEPERRPLGFGRRYIPMRKIWERVGHIVTPATAPASVTADAVAAAERDASGSDPRRESLKRLYTLYLLGGSVDRAADVAERWSVKDPLDADALTARADIAAARGDRDLAIRILGSVVDVRPGDQKAVWRLARLHRWAGRPELACRHSMAAAEIRSTDAKLLADAVRCTRDLGQADVATDLLALADEATRRASDALIAQPAGDPSALSGNLRLEATWDGGDDLDLSLLPPDGARISWLGAPSRAVITARDVESPSREGLALRGGAPGDYVVELTRPAGHRGTVRGSVVVFAAGDRRTVPFAFDGPSTRIALLKITTKPRLVPL